MENVRTTLKSGLQYSRNWEWEGAVVMHNAKTIDLYKKLNEERNHLNCYKYDCFFAFSDRQFAEGLQKIRPLKQGEKLVSVGAGMYGTRDGVERYFAACDEIANRIKEACDPQEVYFYEYNNHESMLSWDGDIEPYRIIERIWGEEAAKGIVRI